MMQNNEIHQEKPAAADDIAVIGLGCVLPDAPDVPAFWNNIQQGKYSIREVPPQAWRIEGYYDTDRQAPNKTYCKIGAFVTHFQFNSLAFRIPPKVAQQMDESQQWTVIATHQALEDAGYLKDNPRRDRTAVILGNSMGGQNRLDTAMGIFCPEAILAIEKTPQFQLLSKEQQAQFIENFRNFYQQHFPLTTEDTMPGELANVISGRVANVFDLRGSNYTTDAACASSLAAFQDAVDGLRLGHFDMAVAGGADRNMSPDSFVKFSKIGALSADKSCPFDKDASGFVMGEGAAVMILKRLADAEQDGDKIYAIIRGLGSSSDGKGKGITAPNPRGMASAIKRAYGEAGVSPATVSLIEAHGTSTIMGDSAEVQALREVFSPYQLPVGSVAIGSVKSQIGHLKSAAGAASLLKTVLSLHHKVLPPSVNYRNPNPRLQLEESPFFVNTQAREWVMPKSGLRRAGISSFGFGGTNFHLVVDEHIPIVKDQRRWRRVNISSGEWTPIKTSEVSFPLEIALVGATDRKTLAERLQHLATGKELPPKTPSRKDREAALRVAISYSGQDELRTKAQKMAQAVASGNDKALQMLANQGSFCGQGAPGKIAFLFPGQGSQYVNMGYQIYQQYQPVREVFARADELMTPRLGRKLTDYLFFDKLDEAAIVQAEKALTQTKITQPAVLAVDIAYCKMLEQFGIRPDMVLGHSLGEYAALVVAGVLSFENALIAASARAKEMSDLQIDDLGKMASVFADFSVIEEVLAQVDGYVIAANKNSPRQTVIGGATAAVEKAVAIFAEKEIKTVMLPVSHAFHTEIVAPAAPRLRKILETMEITAPGVPLISNVTGNFYPARASAKDIVDLLEKQIASSVEFTKGIETLYQNGARIFVEVGPKRALSGLTRDILADRPHYALYCSYPKKKDELTSFNETLAALYAAGVGRCGAEKEELTAKVVEVVTKKEITAIVTPQPEPQLSVASERNSDTAIQPTTTGVSPEDSKYLDLGKAVGKFIEAMQQFQPPAPASSTVQVAERQAPPTEPLVVSGISLGLPGRSKPLFSEDNFERIFAGENCIDELTLAQREEISRKNIVRLIKRAHGDPTLESLDSPDQVVHFSGQCGTFDLGREFGISHDWADTMDPVVQMAFAAGLLALRDAGIPLVVRYRTTSTGNRLPSHWSLPEELCDETGVIFASAFPNSHHLVDEVQKHARYLQRQEILGQIRGLAETIPQQLQGSEYARGLQQLQEQLSDDRYQFHRKFLLRVLPMGCAQMAQRIGARGPNTHINSACASTSVALGIAQDWIRTGRCRRVLIVAADNPTSDVLSEWTISGFLALGAATTQKRLENAALPFDRRRNGMIVGMGAVGIVVEEPQVVRERGMRGVADLLGVEYLNSAFHVSQLDVRHIKQVMDKFLAKMERQYGFNRRQIAGETMFMSHETYTPARGGSAASEIESLRFTFGAEADKIVIANTKGFTGHAMGAGVEEVVAAEALRRQYVPPVANFRETDPGLGQLNLSQGKHYPLRYALKFAAGFGSQMAISLMRRIEGSESRTADANAYSSWLRRVSQEENPQLEVVDNTLRVHNDLVDKIKASQKKTKKQKGAPAPEKVAQPPQEKPVAKASEDIKAKILALVAEKTGYPVDMLELDLDLEADLGIDTVKQAEIFSLIRERFGLARDEDLQLKDYPTLQHLIDYVGKESGSAPTLSIATPTATPLEVSAPVQKTVAPSAETTRQILEIVSAKTGYPADMLELDLDLEADLGIDTVKQAEVFSLIRERFGLARDEDLQLKDYPTLQHLIDYVQSQQRSTAAPVETTAETMPTAQPQAASAPALGQIHDDILQIVSDKTGYPVDMLELDLDLEADLGIDTVKQAEVFSIIRERFGLARDEDLQLKEYPTLQHLIDYVQGQRDDAAPVVVRADTFAGMEPQTAEAPAEALVGEQIHDDILQIVSDKTGYPVDMLELDLDLEADLGIDTVKQAEVFSLIRERFGLARDEDLQLKEYPTLQHLIDYVGAATPAATTTPAAIIDSPAAQPQHVDDAEIQRFQLQIVPRDLAGDSNLRLTDNGILVVSGRDNPIESALLDELQKLGAKTVVLTDDESRQGQVHVDFGDAAKLSEAVAQIAGEHEPIGGLIYLRSLNACTQMDEVFAVHAMREVEALFVIAQKLAEIWQKQPVENTFLCSATALGGDFAIGGWRGLTPFAGAICGLTKALAKELPQSRVKICDFPGDIDSQLAVKSLLDELQHCDKQVEVGFYQGKRHTVEMYPHPLWEKRQAQIQFDSQSVFVISGGARGITAEVAKDLARHFQPRMVLLGTAAIPDNIEELAAMDETQLANFKKELHQQLKQTQERVTPMVLEREFSKYTRAISAHRNIAELRELGATIHYHACDVCDEGAVHQVIQKTIDEYGQIDVVIHGAGIEESRSITNKKRENFQRIVAVKIAGGMSLVQNALPAGLKMVVLFSSVAGRFGNIGQTDYSAANDFLNKYAAWLNANSSCRAVSMNWSGWADIGMATQESVRKIFAEAEISLIPLAQGATLVRREMQFGDQAEVVIAGKLGFLDADGQIVSASQSKAALAIQQQITAAPKNFAMLDAVAVCYPHRIALRRHLSLERDLYLADHALDNVPLFPGVMGLETFAEAATAAMPKRKVVSIGRVGFDKALKILKGRAVDMDIYLEKNSSTGELFDARLCSDFCNDQGHKLGDTRTHFTATIKMAEQYPQSGDFVRLPDGGGQLIEQQQIYQHLFHGPRFQVCRQALYQAGKSIVAYMDLSGQNFLADGEVSWAIQPLWLELGWQAAGLYEYLERKRMALPHAIERIRFFGAPQRSDAVEAVVVPLPTGKKESCFFVQIIASNNGTREIWAEMEGYSTVTQAQI